MAGSRVSLLGLKDQLTKAVEDIESGHSDLTRDRARFAGSTAQKPGGDSK